MLNVWRATGARQVCRVLVWCVLLWGFDAVANVKVWRSTLTAVPAHLMPGVEHLPTIWQVEMKKTKKYLPDLMPVAGGAERQAKFWRMFSPIKPHRDKVAASMRLQGKFEGRRLLRMLHGQQKYTYVITEQGLFLARVRSQGAKKGYTKHYVVGNFSQKVHFAGECWINRDGDLVIDNNSGTYKPLPYLLAKVADLLRANLDVTVKTEVHSPT